MELEFSRELIIVIVTALVFVIGIPLMMRGHKAESLEDSIQAAAATSLAGESRERRQTRRQRARSRDAALRKPGN